MESKRETHGEKDIKETYKDMNDRESTLAEIEN